MTRLPQPAHSNRAGLERRLKNAQERQRRAERDVDALETELAQLDHEESLALIRSWRGKPDWTVLLSAEHTTAAYMLAGFMLKKLGLDTSHNYIDTKQLALWISVEAKPDPANAAAHVEALRHSIELLVPHIAPHPSDGLLWFAITSWNGSEPVVDCGLELRISADIATVSMVKLRHSTIVETLGFETLGEALFHIQQHHAGIDFRDYVPDPEHAPGGTGEALRQALAAYVEGCRSAGLPIDDESGAEL